MKEYTIQATIPVPDDFDGQAEVRDKIKAEVSALRKAVETLKGKVETAVVNRTGPRPAAVKAA